MSKHRLGKREREAKRNLIRGNLANLSQMERSSGTMRSTCDTDNLLSRTHTMGAYVGASEGRASGTVRMGDGVRINKSAPQHGMPRPNARMGDGTECHVTRKV